MKQVIKITEKELRDSILNILSEDNYSGYMPSTNLLRQYQQQQQQQQQKQQAYNNRQNYINPNNHPSYSTLATAGQPGPGFQQQQVQPQQQPQQTTQQPQQQAQQATQPQQQPQQTTQQPQQQPQQTTQTQQQPELQQGGNSNAMNRQMRRLQRNIQDATNYLNNPNDWKSVNNAFDSLGNCAKFLYRAMGNNVPVNEAQPAVESYVQLCQKAMETIQNKFNEYAQQHGGQVQQQQQQPQYAQDWPTAEKEINQVVKGNFNNWPAQVKQAGWPDDKIAAYRQLANNNARQQRQKKQQQAQQQPQQQQQAISEAIDRVVDKYLK